MLDNDVLVVNAGSSSLKLAVLDPGDQVTASLELERWDDSADHRELAEFLEGRNGIQAAGHRVVHGGRDYTGPVLVDQAVQAGIEALTDLAPLHQGRALAGIEAVRRVLPGVPAVACFDTAFHARLPAAAATYALPAQWRRQFGQGRFTLRRYGFHGLSHGYAARRAAQLLDGDLASLRIVTCHLGAGASLAAVSGGRSVDTTMGFTPTEGLVMNTRSGSVDPGLVLWLAQHGGLGPAELTDGLERQAGLAGLADLASGSGDLRDVRAAAQAGSPEAGLAIEVYLHQLRREIAAMAAAMNGLDALVFTGGVGEHDPGIRAGAADGLAFLGVAVDPGRNAAATGDTEITAAGAPVRTLRITAREDVEIARQARELIHPSIRTSPAGPPPA
ncbi:MAG TPA: acetate/propionate family kinase [Streptosporangiaceae bacterium]|nr:acetate/propionate family kinase [Streptosporangiaceae bacterium]